MNNTFYLRDFLVTSKLGPICCGLSKEDIISVLGEPELYEQYDGIEREELLKYEALSVRLEFGAVSMYGLYFGWGDKVPGCLNPVGYFPDSETTIKEFHDYLIREQIQIKEAEAKRKGLGVLTESMVAVTGGPEHISSIIFACPGTSAWRTIHEEV